MDIRIEDPVDGRAHINVGDGTTWGYFEQLGIQPKSAPIIVPDVVDHESALTFGLQTDPVSDQMTVWQYHGQMPELLILYLANQMSDLVPLTEALARRVELYRRFPDFNDFAGWVHGLLKDIDHKMGSKG
jgi:hypothetical protein